MSIKARLADAKELFATGRREGALLSVLIAVAATARKRYPKPAKGSKSTRATDSDRGAFEAFVHDSMPSITGTQDFTVKFRGQRISLAALLYKFIRTEVANEALLPADIRFRPAASDGVLRVETTDDFVSFSDNLIDALAEVVRTAPENV